MKEYLQGRIMKMTRGEGRGEAGGKTVLILCLHTRKTGRLSCRNAERFPGDTGPQNPTFPILNFLFLSVLNCTWEGDLGSPRGALFHRDSFVG